MSGWNLKSILVATDLSGASGELLRSAAALASLTRADLHVLSALEVQDTSYTNVRELATTFAAPIADAERVLSDLIRRTVPHHVPVASRMVVMQPAYKAIARRARKVSADLVVLGPHRGRLTDNGRLGNTADRVIRTVGVPCLIVRGPMAFPLRRIVAPSDLSSHSRQVVRTALRWGIALGASAAPGIPATLVTSVHVIPGIMRHGDTALQRSLIGPELEKQLSRAVARMPAASTLRVATELMSGDRPAGEIVDFALAERADLIVIGTHGSGAVGRALIGSVASDVARDAGCAVLLVPPRPSRGRTTIRKVRSRVAELIPLAS